MENFNEFDNLTTTPQKDSSSVIAHAFEIYKKGFAYAVLMVVLVMIVYYALSFIGKLISGFDPLAASEAMRSGSSHFTNVFLIPGYSSFLGIASLLGLLLYPFNAGLLYVFNKINFNQPVEFSDLFIGYKQNTGQIILFGFIYNIILVITFSICILPAIFIAPLFLFGLPIVFFENASAIDGLKKSFEMAKDNYWVVVGIAVLAFLISISGLILCCIGVIFTAPFIYVGIYSAYCAFFGAPKPIVKG
jgi:hypothetical protein